MSASRARSIGTCWSRHLAVIIAGMGVWWRALVKLIWAAYMLLTSLYCLLAFLPYTDYALIKSPAYSWMPWFVQHHAHLYWATLLAVAAASWPNRKRRAYVVLFAALTVAGIFITVKPFLGNVHQNAQAYAWSVAALIPVVLFFVTESVCSWSEEAVASPNPFRYSPLVWSAITITVLALLGAKIQNHALGHVAPQVFDAAMQEGSVPNAPVIHPSGFELGRVELVLWSLITHVVVAIAIVSILSLIYVVAAKTSRPRLVRYGAVVTVLSVSLIISVARFLNDALGFQRWPSLLYASLLVLSLTFVGLSLLISLQADARPRTASVENDGHKRLLVLGIIAVAAMALTAPLLIGEWDWHGVFQRVLAVVLWVSLSAGFSMFNSKHRTYSVPAVVAILLVTGVTYKALQATKVLWAKSLGPEEQQITQSMERYGSWDASFQFAHHLLGNAPPAEACGDLCRILRQYTNIHNAKISARVDLVSPLVAAKGPHPNIFIIVVDSLRPDYLGAYNPNVDFTPNLDAFAHESAVFRNAYTQYAGTFLSEPAIWTGALLLHSHYVRPFENVNSLERLARTDGYSMVISLDVVLKELLSPKDDLIALDTDKPSWRGLELCSTVEQLAKTLDAHSGGTHPVFFYAQPQNVHGFASNQQPSWQTTDWRRAGFNSRIALEAHQVDACMGKFVSYLKARGLFDNSIIVVTSDHGDATGELGRRGHSYLIYPEVMKVPLIIHLPNSMRGRFVYDDGRIATLTDITPSLYYLLGHRPVLKDPLFGRSLFAETRKELAAYPRHEIFLASDAAAIYGLLSEDGRYMYVTYDSPPQSFLFDLAHDPDAEHSILTGQLKREYDQRIIDYLKIIADFYGYKPGMSSFLVSRPRQ